MDQQTLIELTADIVAAHLANNKVTGSEVPGIINAVHRALAQAVEPPAQVEALVPAVPVKASIKPGKVTCLECGRSMKMLKRHLSVDHELTPEAYRARWGLAHDHALVAPDYAKRRAELAVTAGLGRKKGETAAVRAKGKTAKRS